MKITIQSENCSNSSNKTGKVQNETSRNSPVIIYNTPLETFHDHTQNSSIRETRDPRLIFQNQPALTGAAHKHNEEIKGTIT